MANADAVSNKDIQEQVKKGVQDYRQSLFPDKDLETKKKVVEKLQKAYINASPEGRKNILNLLGASQTIIDNSLTATQKMDVLHDSNALLKNMSFEKMSASSLPQPKERMPEDYVKFSIVAGEFAAAVGAASLSAIAAMAAADNLDAEMAAKILLVMLSIQAAMMAVGLIADGINNLVEIFKKTPEQQLLADRQELFKLQDKILTNRHDPKIIDKAMGESSKILLKYANDPLISKQLNKINETRGQLNSIMKDLPNTNLDVIKDLLQQKEREIANKVRESAKQPQDQQPPVNTMNPQSKPVILNPNAFKTFDDLKGAVDNPSKYQDKEMSVNQQQNQQQLEPIQPIVVQDQQVLQQSQDQTNDNELLKLLEGKSVNDAVRDETVVNAFTQHYKEMNMSSEEIKSTITLAYVHAGIKGNDPYPQQQDNTQEFDPSSMSLGNEKQLDSSANKHVVAVVNKEEQLRMQ